MSKKFGQILQNQDRFTRAKCMVKQVLNPNFLILSEFLSFIRPKPGFQKPE